MLVLPGGNAPPRCPNLELSRYYKYRPHACAWERLLFKFGAGSENRTRA